jgi:dCTP deaminase
MILSDKDIKKEIKKGTIVIKPFPNFKTQLSACSLDLHLGNKFLVFQYTKSPFIDIKKPMPRGIAKTITISDDQFVIQPGEFILGITGEWIELSDSIAARLEGRSSIGRLGIIIHATASLIPPGWRGRLVLEIANIARIPVALYPGMRICALTFEKISSAVEIPYCKNKNAKYLNQNMPVISRIKLDL